jgi:dTDP-4-dehydrorhamnose reductase
LNFKRLSETLAQISPDIIIHAAGEGSVDAVQNQIESYTELNVTVTKKLAQYCNKFNKKLIFISSNAVYGGSNSAYSENSDYSPINDYGILKVKGEKAVRNFCNNYLIVRPIMMYGWPSPGKRINLVANWIKLLRLEQSVSVVDDIFTQPLAAWDCAKAIWKSIQKDMVGELNVSGGDLISLYNLALLTGKVFDLNIDLIKSVKSAHFSQFAPRPKCTIFDLTRLKSELNIKPDRNVVGLIRLRDTEKGG